MQSSRAFSSLLAIAILVPACTEPCGPVDGLDLFAIEACVPETGDPSTDTGRTDTGRADAETTTTADAETTTGDDMCIYTPNAAIGEVFGPCDAGACHDADVFCQQFGGLEVCAPACGADGCPAEPCTFEALCQADGACVPTCMATPCADGLTCDPGSGLCGWPTKKPDDALKPCELLIDSNGEDYVGCADGVSECRAFPLADASVCLPPCDSDADCPDVTTCGEDGRCAYACPDLDCPHPGMFCAPNPTPICGWLNL